MTPLLVGLDIGTTSVKAVVYEPDGRAVARAAVPTLTHYPRPGWAFYRAAELWGQAVAALRAALREVDEPRRVAGIAVASMGEAGVPLDGADRPTADVIAWFDTRTKPQAEWLARTFGRDELWARTGLSLQPIFTLCKLIWLKEHEPDAWRRTVRWLHVADFVAYRLGGAPATDFSLASRTLAFDLRRRRWDDDLLRAAGCDPAMLAPLTTGGTDLGGVSPEAAAATGLPVGARVAVGGHDHVCGALALGVTEPGTLLDSFGTAEMMFLALEAPLADAALGRQGYTQGAHVVGDRYYVYAGQYTSGASIDWLRKILGDGHDYAGLIAEAERVPPGSLGACFLPHLRLANPPYDDPRSRGAFVGLTTDVDRGALFRAVLEGLALEARHSLEPLLANPSVPAPRETVLIGGGARNGLLLRLKATVLNRAVTVANVEEATSLGAALLAGLAAGVYPDVATAITELRYRRSVVEPVAADVPFYEELYQTVYRRLYPEVSPLSHAIGDLQAGDGRSEAGHPGGRGPG